MLSPAYLRNNTSNESINPQSGEVSLAQTDYVLPGRNGLDLEIKRIYKSGISNLREMKTEYIYGEWVDQVSSDKTAGLFYEDRYNLGVGMRFSFPALEIKKNYDQTEYIFLHTEAGDVYKLVYPDNPDIPDEEEDKSTFIPEGQTKKDVTIKLNSDFNNGQTDGTSYYVMTDKTGKKTYFAEDGRVLGIVDRYGNKIVFQYSTLTYKVDWNTKTQKLISKIIDTVGREVIIEYKQDENFRVGPIKNEKYTLDNSYKASQNPNATYSGDLQGKFQVIIKLPNGQEIVYDKTAVLVNKSGNVIRTRLQRVFDVDGKPRYHFWYDQPELGFTYTDNTNYYSYIRYENLTQIDYCKTNRIQRFSYNTFKKRLAEKGSMEYRKVFEVKELEKTGFDSSKSSFLDAFIFNVKDKETYGYTNEPDGYGSKEYDEKLSLSYLKGVYRYYTLITDYRNTKTKYTYNGIHDLVSTVETGTNHESAIVTEYDEMRYPKKTETTMKSIEKGKVVDSTSPKIETGVVNPTNPKIEDGIVVGSTSKKVENYRYDDNGNLIFYAGPDVKRDEKGYPLENAKNTIKYTYDYRFNVLSSKTWDIDEDTIAQIEYSIDDKGNVIQEKKRQVNSKDSWLITDYEYDNFGNMIKKTIHPSGNDQNEPEMVTIFEYGVDAAGVDQKGAYITKEFSIIDEVEISKKYAYDFNTGNMVAEIDGNGNKTGYEYDSLSRVIKITNPDNTVKEYYYNNYNTQNKEIEYIDPNGTRSMYKFDIFGNQVEYCVFLNDTWQCILKSEYDPYGNKIKEIDANGNSIRFTYDSQNMLTNKDYYEKDIIKKECISFSYTYGDDPDTWLILTTTDERGFKKRQYYDYMHQLIKSEDTPDNINYYTTYYKYDYSGNLLSETDARGNTTIYTYDDLGRLISKKDALNNETQYKYNSINKPILIQEPLGRTTQYIYDSIGRTIEERIFDKSSLEIYTYKKYMYDKSNNLISYMVGKVEGNADKISSHTEYTYDSMNRIIDEYDRIDTLRKSHKRYTYDKNGNKTSMTEFVNESGSVTIDYAYEYDYDNRVVLIKGTMNDRSSDENNAVILGQLIRKYVYDHVGNRISEEQYNGADFDRITYKHDYRNRLVEKIEPIKASLSRTTEYTYDKTGNIATETIYNSGVACTTQYQYDGMGKMTMKVDPMGYVSKYIYDENGNVIKEIDPRYSSQDLAAAPGIIYEYDALNRQVKSIVFDGTRRTVIDYKEYDTRGNLSKEADGEGYNNDNPLMSAGNVYEYDAFNNVIRYIYAQVCKENIQNGTDKYSKKYTYDGAGRVLKETDFYNNVTQNEYFLNGLLKRKIYPDGSIESYDYDLSGKAKMVKTDKSGNTTTYTNLFGKIYRIEYPDNTTETFEYSPKGELLKSVDKAGYADYFQYDLLGNITDKKEYITSDALYDYYKHIITRYDESGRTLSTETFSYKTSKGKVDGGQDTSTGDRINYSYDKNGRSIKVIGPSGRETINEYDKKGNVITKKQKINGNDYQVNRYKYDIQSRIIEETLLVETSDLDTNYIRNIEFDSEYSTKVKAKTSYTYYNNGQLRTKTDANGNSNTIEYDLDNKPVKKIDALNNATFYKYDYNGNLLEEKNAKGKSTHYEYDSMNRLIRKKAPSADGGFAVTRYIYDVMGNLVKQIEPNSYISEKDTPELADSMEGMSYTYDNMNRRTSTILPDGNAIEYIKYDALGNVIKRVDGLRFNGSIDTSPGTSYEYDAAGNVIKTTNALGYSKKNEYDILGRMVKNTDERGNSTVYFYNSDGTLARTVYADGGEISYTYDLLGRMTSLTNQLGNSTNYSYSSFNGKNSEKDEYGNTLEFKTDLLGNIVALKDKGGSISYSNYDEIGRLIKKRIPIEKDSSGTVFYSVETYTYDEVGNISSKVLTGTKDKLSSRTTNYTYYDNNLIDTVSDSSGSFIKNYYDKNGNLVKKESLRSDKVYDTQKFEYDMQNRVIKEIQYVDEKDIYNAAALPNLDNLKDSEFPGKLMVITAYEYDILGNRTKVTSPLAFGYKEEDIQSRANYTTEYTYDVLNRLEEITRKYNGTDGSISYTYDECGNKIAEKNERGFETKCTYDKLNRVKTLTDALNNTLSNTYDLAGNKLSETNSKGDTMTYTYDKLNRVVTVIDSYDRVINKKVYDANGNVIKEIDALGYLSADNDDSRYGTLYTYDLANRLIAKATPEAAAQNKVSSRYEYNQYGEVVKQTDGLGNTYTYDYDAAGKLIRVIDPLGVATKYSYDKQGSKLTMTDGRGKLTKYNYTAFGKLKTVINPENKEIRYKYDLNGNTACITDENGSNTVYTYDDKGLLLEKKVLETGDSVSYSYDEAGNKKTMSDDSGNSFYSYDANNRLLEVTKDGAAQISYTYDQVGNVTNITDSKGNTISYTYDKSNRMETVTSNGKTATYTYDENGRRTDITYDGGVSEKYTFDKDNQLIKLINCKANGAVISEYSYEYDIAGRQISKTDSFGTTYYTYDKAGRILKVSTPGKTTVYSYDNAGNRISQNETYISPQPSGYVDEVTGKDIQYILKKSDYTYASSNTLLKLVERMFDESNTEVARKTTKYVYDNNGNQLRQTVSYVLPDNTSIRPATKGTAYGDNLPGDIDKLVEKTSYIYDGFNRLKKAETVKDGLRTTAEYVYNGDNLRVSKTIKRSDNGYAAEVTNYLYDRQNVILETDANSNIKARYVKGINYISKADGSGKTSYFLFNGHGDVVQAVDEAGTVLNQYEYDIWGNPVLTIETVENAIRYAGEYLDAETGLYYLRARYYDPYIGRFITEDSYWGEDKNPLSLNLYTYAHNDPIQYIDPTGHTVAKIGTKGDTIRAIQEDLKKLGYKVTVDGIFGAETEAAVKKFQKNNGLQVDGIVGNQTINEIYFEQSKQAAKSQGIELPEAPKAAAGQLKGNVLIITDEKYAKSIENIKQIKTTTKGGSLTTDTQNNELVGINTQVKNVDPKAPDIKITPKKPVKLAKDTEVNALIKTTENTVAAIENTKRTLTIANKTLDDTANKKKSIIQKGTGKSVTSQNTSKSTEEKSLGTQFVDGIQNSLDVAGLVPAAGFIPDAINATIYYARGDETNYRISLAAMIPVVGLGATAAKLAKKADNIVDISTDLAKMETKVSSKTEKHHIVTDKSKKFDFKNHPAIKETGIDISKDIDNLVDLANHRGRHTDSYHKEVQRRLDSIYDRYGGTDRLENAVRNELNAMKQELLDGTLNPYGK